MTTHEIERTEAEIARTTAALADKAHLLEQRVVDVKDRVEQRVADAKQRVEHMVDPRAHVREEPWRSVAIAFAIGFAIGWIS